MRAQAVTRHPPMPEPPPRRRRRSLRAQRYGMWRVKGPASPVVLSTLAERASAQPSNRKDTTMTKPSQCARCQPPCGRNEECDMCGESLPHDYVHWNGAFYQCGQCALLEALDPDQNGLDPI